MTVGGSTERIKPQNVCGIDEVGRGCLAGPVAAGAVVLGDHMPAQTMHTLADSKQLTVDQRETIATAIFTHAQIWAVAWATVPEIDRYNILQASLLAMKRAYQLAITTPLNCDMICGYGTTATDSTTTHNIEEIIVDGIHVPDISPPCQIHSMIKADTQIPAVQAAAIIAKVTRDRLLAIYDRRYPQYGFKQHKGYPTTQHRNAIQQYGTLPIHRRSFKLTY